MFTRSDLSSLMSADPELGVSIFLPTHARGSEVRQDPLRLKNLTAEARDRLSSSGLEPAEVEAFVRPAMALVDDYRFWQHQEEGLAVFLDGGDGHRYKVPIPLAEQVVVGRGFHVRPLLPMLQADGAFLVLTITADRVKLYDSSRFALAEDVRTDLPRSIAEVSKAPDYENPVQASPVGRPHTASISVTNAQVYGDSPAEWNKGQLVDFARRVAQALDDRVAIDPVPVVLVADAELGGHFRKFSRLGPLLAGVIEVNPASLDGVRLHDAAYAAVRPRLEVGRSEAVGRFEALFASRDPRAVTDIEDLVKAAYQGRVDSLLLTEPETVWGRYFEAIDDVVTGEEFAATGEDLLEAAAVQTLRHGGAVHLLSNDEMSVPVSAAAVLRF